MSFSTSPRPLYEACNLVSSKHNLNPLAFLSEMMKNRETLSDEEINILFLMICKHGRDDLDPLLMGASLSLMLKGIDGGNFEESEHEFSKYTKLCAVTLESFHSEISEAIQALKTFELMPESIEAILAAISQTNSPSGAELKKSFYDRFQVVNPVGVTIVLGMVYNGIVNQGIEDTRMHAPSGGGTNLDTIIKCCAENPSLKSEFLEAVMNDVNGAFKKLSVVETPPEDDND